jgi:hypothetical protein
METIDSTLVIGGIVAGIVLFIGLLIFVFRYFLKRMTKKRLLKEEVSKALLRVKTNEDIRHSHNMDYQLILHFLTYKPVKIEKELSKYGPPVEEETTRLLDFFRLKPRSLWELSISFFFEPDLIPDLLLKPPRLTIRTLERKLEELQKLSSKQEVLIGIYEDSMESKIKWKGDLIPQLKKTDHLRVGKILKKEREADEAMTKAEIDGAKAKLQKAIQYVNVRDSDQSLKAGEYSITRGAKYLDFKEVKKFSEKALKKIAVLETEGAESDSIVNFCNVASLNLGQNFEDWAKKIFDKQFSFDEIRGYLKQLGENRKVEIVADKELTDQIMNLFQDTIPENWSAANWESLQENIDEVDTALHKMRELTKDLESWADEITDLEVRIQAVLAKEEYLEEHYGKDEAVTPSKEWSSALASWKNKVSGLWANGQYDELEDILDSLETPLVQHSYKVGNRLDEAENLAGITPQKIVDVPSRKSDEDFAARLADIKHAGQPSADKPKRRRPSHIKHERKLTGNMVTVISHGIPIEVDSSLKDTYQKEDPVTLKEKEKKKKKHTK